MSKLLQQLGMKKRDESRGRNETNAHFLARMVKENAHRNNFSALTFRFCYNLNLDLPTAELARMIAGYGYPVNSLDRYSELELSAASVYLASYVRGAPKTLTKIAQLTGVSSNTIHAVYLDLYRAQEGLKDADWHDIFGGPSRISAAEMRRDMSYPSFKA